MKSNFEWRLNGYDRMGAAKLHKIGMGVLIGLEDWRTDITMMAYHLRYLQKKILGNLVYFGKLSRECDPLKVISLQMW